jgi:hypothetical protein
MVSFRYFTVHTVRTVIGVVSCLSHVGVSFFNLSLILKNNWTVIGH